MMKLVRNIFCKKNKIDLPPETIFQTIETTPDEEVIIRTIADFQQILSECESSMKYHNDHVLGYRNRIESYKKLISYNQQLLKHIRSENKK